MLYDTDRAEAVFIGRSNVGKSAVNMVTARKALAFTETTGKDPAVQFLCREQAW
jgi:GTP-binding protein EngB required for normal cell division